MATEAELEFLKSQKYYAMVVLGDGTICGLSRLMYTTTLYIGLNGGNAGTATPRNSRRRKRWATCKRGMTTQF